jgi:hypothetical protein
MATRTISPAGGNFTTAATWVEGVIPTSADDVVANAASGPLVIVTASVCRSFDLTGMTKAVSGSGVFFVIGDSAAGPGNVLLKIPAAGFTYTFNGTYQLRTSAPTPQTVSVSRSHTGQIMVDGTGTVLLAASLTLTTVSGVLTHTAGTLDFNGQAVTVNSLVSSGSTVRTLIVGSGVVTLSPTTGIYGFDVTGSNYTVSAATSTLSMGANAGFRGGGATYGTVQWLNLGTSFIVAIVGSNTFTNLSIAQTGATHLGFHFPPGGTQTVTGAFTLTATGRIRVGTGQNNFFTFDMGMSSTIALGATATATVSNVSFADIIFTGANTPVSGPRLGDGGGNAGITFNASRTLYWVGGTGPSSDVGNAHWALSSGGAPGAGVPYPLPQDDIVIDTNSFTAVNQTITFDTNWICRNLTANVNLTGCKWLGTSNTGIFGSYVSTGTGGFLPGDFYMWGRVDSALKLGATGNTVHVQVVGATVTMQEPLVLTGILDVTSGTFNAAGYTVTVRFISATTTSGVTTQNRTLRMGGAAWIISGVATSIDMLASPTFTLAIEGSTLRAMGALTADSDFATVTQVMPPLTVETTGTKAVRLVAGTGWSTVDHVSGNLTYSGTVTTDVLTSVGSLSRTLTFSGGTVLVRGLVLRGTNLTVVTTSGTMNIFPNTRETKIYTNGATFLTINFGIGPSPPAGGLVFVVMDPLVATNNIQVNAAAGRPIDISFNGPATAGNQFNSIGNATGKVRLYGPEWGGRVLFTAAANVITSTDFFMNIDKAGAAAWSNAISIDSGYTSQAIEV